MAANDNKLVTLADLEAAYNNCAEKSDLTSIIATGTTNQTGATISPSNPYFYLNGVLVRAKTDIASGATFTSGTNYEVVTQGGLNNTWNVASKAIVWNSDNVSGDNRKNSYIQINKIVIAVLEFTPLSGRIATNNVIASGLPAPIYSNYFVTQAGNRQIILKDNGDLAWWYPTDTSDLSRIDLNFVYVTY